MVRQGKGTKDRTLGLGSQIYVCYANGGKGKLKKSGKIYPNIHHPGRKAHLATLRAADGEAVYSKGG